MRSFIKAFIDLLFNINILFYVLFVLAFIQIKPKDSKKDIEEKAEYVVVLEWQTESADDIDLYVRDPLGNLCFFRTREAGLLALSRDDLGHANDIIQTPAGPIRFNENREVITVRKSVPGEYVINTHVFHKRSGGPAKVKVRLEKVPFELIFFKEFEMVNHGEEATAFRFTIDTKGKVTKISQEPASLIQRAVGQY